MARPTNSTKDAQWGTHDAWIISWILGSVELSIVLDLHLCIKLLRVCRAIWSDFTIKRTQPNDSKFQQGYEITEYSQGNQTIKVYYSSFINLWTEFTELVYASPG